MQFTLAVYTFWIMATVLAANVIGIGVIAALSWRDMARRAPAPPTLDELRIRAL